VDNEKKPNFEESQNQRMREESDRIQKLMDSRYDLILKCTNLDTKKSVRLYYNRLEIDLEAYNGVDIIPIHNITKLYIYEVPFLNTVHIYIYTNDGESCKINLSSEEAEKIKEEIYWRL